MGVIGSMDYYTGLIFRGYAKGTGSSVLDGGRYDNMVEKFGTDMPAVGFALKVNDLMKVMGEPDERGCTYLAVYDNESRFYALKETNELRKKGISVENSFCGCDVESNKAYALKKNISNILILKVAK